jgi:predicted ATPase/DNA-binding CsgD family transcriptional regulator/tetratricopeptide (TPR) repeat protein
MHHASSTVRVVWVGTNSFLGREEELAGLTEMLEHSPLITLTGPPGIGKSRLAWESAAQAQERYDHGTAVVELAAVREDAHVPTAIAAALSAHEAHDLTPTQALIGRLGHRHLLLVLDNCEHVLAASRLVVGALLDGCDRLSILATSREPLGIAGETVWSVPPLAVPPPSGADPTGYPSVRLFEDRARAADPRFTANPHVAPAIAEICRRLDGIPLAIEFAAARVESLTPAEIADHLVNRFHLLVGEEVAAVPRHQTLVAALEWSYALLTDDERLLLRRLSTFCGGFDRAACETVCCRDDLGPDVLDRLVSKSLVVADSSSDRFTLLETIRAYAAERLSGTESLVEREAHARFFVALAEDAERELSGPLQERWLERLETERANLRAAVEWSVCHGQPEWALRITGSLVVFWRVRSHFRDGLELLAAAINASAGGADAALEARARWGVGLMAHWLGDTAAAVPLLQESHARFAALGSPGGRARALMTLGSCRQRHSCTDALALFEQSAALAREAGDTWCLATSLAAAGACHSSCGDSAVARERFEECVDVARQAGDKQGLRMALVGMGELELSRGDHKEAESLFAEAVAVADDLGDDYTKSWALHYLGAVVARRDLAAAARLLDRSLELIRETRPVDLVVPLVSRARIARAAGQHDHARRLLEEALTLARTGSPGTASALIGMGELTADEGDARAARRLFEEALDLARRREEPWAAALALHALADLARARGERRQATGLYREALELRRRHESTHGMVVAIEAVGGVAAEAGRAEYAAQLLGAAEALRQTYGFGRSTVESQRYDADLELARRAMAASAFASALDGAAAWTLQEAATKALNGHNCNVRPTDGWPSLTETERQVAVLVADGLTNSAIGERLYMSLGTVKDHLAHIFGKLGVSARTELAREVGRQEQLAHNGH